MKSKRRRCGDLVRVISGLILILLQVYPIELLEHQRSALVAPNDKTQSSASSSFSNNNNNNHNNNNNNSPRSTSAKQQVIARQRTETLSESDASNSIIKALELKQAQNNQHPSNNRSIDDDNDNNNNRHHQFTSRNLLQSGVGSILTSEQLITDPAQLVLRFEFQRYDGWYNNLANSDWGTPNSRLRRKVAPAYSDGVYQMLDEGRPSARLLSQRMMRGDDGQSSRRNLTTIFAFFGQVISSEILMASESGCPIEMHRIKIEKCDSMYDRDCRGGRTMPFYRASYDPHTGQSPNLPREQVNKVTSWIDGSFIYSTSETWLNTMRSFNGRGTLKMVGSPNYQASSSSSSSSIKRSEYNLDTLLMDPLAVGSALAQSLSSSINAKPTSTTTPAPVEASTTTTSTTTTTTTTLGVDQSAADNLQVPMSLFGYPLRNKKRAPLINQMPAHHLTMKTAERMFLLGDPRTNQNPMILSFGILFYRWHNVLAERIHTQHPEWSDEEIFQRARRLVIASLQNVFLYEYLPTLLDTPAPYDAASGKISAHLPAGQTGARKKLSASNSSTNINDLTHSELLAASLEADSEQQQQQLVAKHDINDLIQPYTGYKPDLHPGISHVFQSAAFRFGHTMIPPGLYLRDDKCQFLNTPSGYKGIRLCSTWWNAEEVISKVGIEQLLMGAASQIAEREDYVLCNDVRDKLFGPLDFSRRDLAALNIMRGRDNGLPDYNTVRQAFKLPKITKWRDINPELFRRQPELFDELAQLYDNQLDKVDLYIGGMLESDLTRGRPGALFRRIIKEQFERLRDSDRFWFENLEAGIFSESEIEQIRQIKLYDIIVNSTLIPDDSIQRNVFKFEWPQDPCPQPKQLSSSELQPCYTVKGHSYFKGSELTYALVCLTLVLIPLICLFVASMVIKYQDRKRRQFKAKQEYLRNIQAGSKQAAAAAAARNGNNNKNLTNSRNSSSSHMLESNDDALTKCEKFYTKEWLHSNLKRKIKVRFGPAPDETLYILDRKCQVQRRLNLSQVGTVVVELSSNYAYTLPGAPTHPLQAANSASVASKAGSTASLISSSSASSSSMSSSSPCPTNLNPLSVERDTALLNANELTAVDLDQPVNHKPMILIRVARNHDLVLQFYDVQQRRKFIFKLQTYLRSINKSMSLYRVPRDVMLANAETKEKRQQRLEQFFREAYALTFGLSGSENGDKSPNSQHTTGASGHALGNTTANNDHHHHHALSKVSPDISLVMRTSLSRQEFAEALGMKSDSLFVKQMFNCVDKDGNGRISFQEFLDTVVMFSRGKPDDKLRIIFDMCDYSGKGVIEKQELVRMLRSLVDIAKTKSLTENGVMEMIHEMFKAVGLENKPMLTYDDFKLIISNHNQGSAASSFKSTLNLNQPHSQDGATSANNKFNTFNNMGQQILAIGLDMKGAKKNFFVDTSATCAYMQNQQLFDQQQQQQQNAYSNKDGDVDIPMSVAANRYRKMTVVDTGAHKRAVASHFNQRSGFGGKKLGCFSLLRDKWRAFITELEEHRQDIVYLLMFYVIVAVLFFERFIIYSFLSEHMDLRHVMGVGIAITRGSAASLSFCYAMLLLSMCRNIMTWIRTMGIREYIPLDSHVKFHKVVAMTALVMTVLHTVGHCINFYHVTQQPVEHLRCLTKEMQFSGESRPTFFYWIFQTVTGSTGLLLWILCSIVYVFAQQKVRQRAYSIFWSTHKLYYLIYALTLLHGSSKLTGSPRFWIFFMIPAILFTIDKIMSLQAKLLQLEIFETECLPSGKFSLDYYCLFSLFISLFSHLFTHLKNADFNNNAHFHSL